MHRVWLERLQSLHESGKAVSPRGEGTLEQLNMKFELPYSKFNLLDVASRKLSYKFAVAEWLWMMFGRSDVATIKQYNENITRFSDNGETFAGAYGPHIRGQRAKILHLLSTDPNTRQAVIEIPRPYAPTKDEPCTLSLQFLNRDSALHCIATMRSSDVWLGLPYDVFNFTQIQNCFAGALELERGWFSLNAGSSHLYDRDRQGAFDCMARSTQHTIVSPRLPGFPPDWLEDVLVNRDASAIPSDINVNSHWLQYALVLLATNQIVARGVLVG